MNILFEDPHLIILNKAPGIPVQPGKGTSVKSLQEEVKAYLFEQHSEDVPVGLVHRIDQPTSGVVVFTKSSKALSALNRQFQERTVQKKYWVVTESKPDETQLTLVHWLRKEQRKNKSFYFPEEVKNSKKAILSYRFLRSSDRYHLLEVELETGRHHQIRAQLSAIGCPIKGDLKYGAKRSNKDGSIHLHAKTLEFKHPISGESIQFEAAVPEEVLWKYFED